jgi:hypothetical protein
MSTPPPVNERVMRYALERTTLTECEFITRWADPVHGAYFRAWHEQKYHLRHVGLTPEQRLEEFLAESAMIDRRLGL